VTKHYRYLVACIPCLVCAFGPAAFAGQVNFSTAGWYSNASSTDAPVSNNYFAGLMNGFLYRDFFTFDLTGQSGTFTAATLTVTNRQDTIPAVSMNTSDTYSVYTTNSTVTALNNGTAGYANVVTGSPVGSISTNFNNLTDGQQLVITLSSAEVAAINSLIGTGVLSIGGQVSTANVTSFNAAATTNDYLFVGAGGGATPPQAGDVFLTLTATSAVPEPGTLILFGSAMIGLCAFRLRFRA